MAEDTKKITRYRGDTEADVFRLTTSGVPVDITGWAFKLTVNAQKDPSDTSQQKFSLTGAIVGDPTAGTVEFVPTTTQADQVPGKYYYDFQATTGAGRIRTLAKDEYHFVQDISK